MESDFTLNQRVDEKRMQKVRFVFGTYQLRN